MTELSAFLRWFDAACEKALREGQVIVRGKRNVRQTSGRSESGPGSGLKRRNLCLKAAELLKLGRSTRQIVEQIGCSPQVVTVARGLLAGKKWARVERPGLAQNFGPA